MTSTLRWFKSSYSNASGGNCVEIAFDWHKSSYSSSSGGNCVEVATCRHSVHVRDSKIADGPTFSVDPAAWTRFLKNLGG
ncbi:DUF397 domain-containing protein [Streptomyces niveus]|uniref:DUF397 domain-containing protein n=1 Tax=Streptomyces niveus TaxID=193462 RepID=UPI0003C5EA87|nr:DUF397 domain-containing protein [Streptomyces niveus]EST26883.1 hypothetical protein M877_17875 [Streptomyces niveus NCIMB 11891]